MPLSLSPSLLMSSASSVAFSPAALFASGEQGAWYDPSDLSTMFQDTAGTTPVTATGQTVGLLLDKSGRGNHATQATAASRPIYGIEPFGGRRNLLTFTEQFDNAAWVKFGGSTSANTTVAPDGTTTADRFVEDSTTGDHNFYQVCAVTSGLTYTYSIYLKADGRTSVNLRLGGTGFSPVVNAVFNLVDGTVTSGPGTITASGNGWYRCTITGTAASSANANINLLLMSGGATSYTGNGTSGLFIWGAQLETGSTATAYQRVTDQWNVTQAGVPSVAYIQCDGTDDFLLTGTITPGTDKAQVFAGVRQSADATGAIVETSADSSTNNGAFSLFALAGADDTQLLSRGTAAVNVRYSGATKPFTAVYAGTADIAADGLVLRANGTQVGSNTADQGTGNFLAYPLYIGRRGGTTLPFNGRIYGLAVRFGANLSAAQISQMETWMAGKTGVTI